MSDCKNQRRKYSQAAWVILFFMTTFQSISGAQTKNAGVSFPERKAPVGINLLEGQSIEKDGAWVGGFYGANKKGEIKWGPSAQAGDNGITLAGQEPGVTGFMTLKNAVPITMGVTIYLDYTGKCSSEKSSAQIRCYDDAGKDAGKFVIIPKVAPGQWFTLSKAECAVIFMGVGADGKFQNGSKKIYSNTNSFTMPPNVTRFRVDFFCEGVSTMSIKDVVLLKETLTAEEKNIREEQDRLLLKMEEKKAEKRNDRAAGFTLSVDEVALKPVKKPLPDGWPVPAVTIKNGTFYLNGNPAYLTGVESEATLQPFLYKLLGLDFIQYTTPYLISTARVKKTSNAIHFGWTVPYRDVTLGVRDLLAHGLLPYVQMIEGGPDQLNAFYKFSDNAPDLLVDFGHFYGLRHDNPDAWAIRENFFKNNLSALLPYPIFAIETYNEVLFIDGGPQTISRFHDWCKNKYSTLEKLNEVWQTKYASFGDIIPPVVNGWTYSFASLPENISRMMWRDWTVFSSANSQEAFKKTYDLVKKYRPDALVTVQSHVAHMYDHVFCGIEAKAKSKAEDIYGDERGFVYKPQIAGRENPLAISAMLSGALWLDYLAHLLPEQTQMSEESPVRSDFVDLDEQMRAVNLNDGDWKFQPDDADAGKKDEYFNINYDDSKWKPIHVPGMWATQGYPDVIQGWYRRSFTLEAETLKEPLYLNGIELAAETDIYLNGQLIHKKNRTSERVSMQVNSFLTVGKNFLVIRLRDDYLNSGYYWGGIRGSISLDFVSPIRMPINFGQVRSYYWERMLHGESGSIISYAYVPEGYHRFALFNPKEMNWDAFRAFPQVKCEFKNCADIVLRKKLRLNARVALCYPQETMRYHIANTFTDASKGPLGHDVRTWYAGLIGGGVPTAVIPNSRLTNETINEYKMIFMQGNERVPEGAMAMLEKYIASGGVLLIDGASLQREDDFNQKIEREKIAGCSVGDAYSNSAKIASNEFGLQKSITVGRLRDGITGWTVTPQSAEILLSDIQNRPVLLKNKYGKGSVYTLAANPDGRSLVKIFSRLMADNGEKADVDFATNEPAPWIERYLLGNNGRYVAYLHNWGGGKHDGKIEINKPLAPGQYTVRNLETGKAVAQNISAQRIASDGLPVTLLSQNPIVLLLENSAPRELCKLTDEQNKYLDFIDRKPLQNIPTNKRIMMYSGGLVTYSRIKLLTAAYALEQNGYECVAGFSAPMSNEMEVYNGGLKTEKLNDFGIVFIGGNRGRLAPSEVELLGKYVTNGGRLFFCGNWSRSTWLGNNENNKMLGQFGADLMNYSYVDTKNCDDNVEFYPIFNNFAKSPLTENINAFVSHGMAVVRVNKDWNMVVLGIEKCADASLVSQSVEKTIGKEWRAAAIAVREYGKGKIVVCGDPSWLEGDNLEQGDNKKLFLNLINWLSK